MNCCVLVCGSWWNAASSGSGRACACCLQCAALDVTLWLLTLLVASCHPPRRIAQFLSVSFVLRSARARASLCSAPPSAYTAPWGRKEAATTTEEGSLLFLFSLLVAGVHRALSAHVVLAVLVRVMMLLCARGVVLGFAFRLSSLLLADGSLSRLSSMLSVRALTEVLCCARAVQYRADAAQERRQRQRANVGRNAGVSCLPNPCGMLVVRSFARRVWWGACVPCSHISVAVQHALLTPCALRFPCWLRNRWSWVCCWRRAAGWRSASLSCTWTSARAKRARPSSW